MAHGHETLTEIVGTAGRLTVGRIRASTASTSPMRTACATSARRPSTSASPRRSCNEAQAFVDVVREDAAPPLTLHDATEATRIGIAVTESLRTKRSVEL